MKRLLMLLGFLLIVLAPPPAYASHGMVTLPDCGTYEVHLEEDYTKGTSDAAIYHVDHTVGCKHAILSGLVPAGIGEAQMNEWQVGTDKKSGTCARYGKEHAVGVFNYGWHTTINPEDVTVTCTPYGRRS